MYGDLLEFCANYFMAYANVKSPETYIILCINYISIKRTLQLFFSNSTHLNKSIVNRFIKNQIPSLVQYIQKYSLPLLWASGSVSEALVFKSCSPQTSFSARLEKEAHLRSGIRLPTVSSALPTSV